MKPGPKMLVATFLLLTLLVASALAATNEAVQLRLYTAWRYIAMGWHEEAVEHAAEAVKAGPQHAEARLLLALLRHAEGAVEEALWHYDLVLSLDPDMAMVAALMGDVRFHQGRYDEAIALYNQALSADPSLGLAYYGLGRVLETRGDTEARGAYERGVHVAPDMAELRYRLGKMLREAGEYDAALVHLLHANLIDSSLAHVRFELGLTYEALARFSAAEHEYRTALRLDPSLEQARDRLAALPPM